MVFEWLKAFNWQLLLLGIFVAIAIYLFWKHSEDETRTKIVKLAIPLLLIGAVFLYWRSRGNTIEINTADFWLFLAVMGYITGKLFIYEERYKTQGQVIADNFSGSYYTEPVKVGAYTIFNVGSFCHIIPWEKGNATLVVPTHLVHYLDIFKKKAYCKVQVTRRDIRKLPLYITNYIYSNHNLNQTNVYFGMFDRETRLYGKEIKLEDGRILTPLDFEEEFLNMNSQINRYQEFADGRSKDLEDMAAFMDRVGKKVRGTKLFVRKKREEEQEEE